MTIIKECNMPDLSNLGTKQILARFLSVVFQDAPPKEDEDSFLVTNFIRITDHTIREYNYARQSLEEYVKTPTNHMSPRFVTTAHLEHCLISLRRSLRFAESINDEVTDHLLSNLSISSNPDKRIIKGLRNSIEHWDDRVICEDAEPPDVLWIEEEGFHLYVREEIDLSSAGKGISNITDQEDYPRIKIRYRKLAQWLKDLHETANKLALPFDG